MRSSGFVELPAAVRSGKGHDHTSRRTDDDERRAQAQVAEDIMLGQTEQTGKFAYIGLGTGFVALLVVVGVSYWSIFQLRDDFE